MLPHSLSQAPSLLMQTNVPPVPTDLIRLELDSRCCSYYPQLDAVRMTGYLYSPPLAAAVAGQAQIEGVATADLPRSSSPPTPPPPLERTTSYFSELLRPSAPQIALQVQRRSFSCPSMFGGQRVNGHLPCRY